MRTVLEHHITPREVGQVLDRVRPDLALLTHVVLKGPNAPRIEEMLDELAQTYDRPVLVARDLRKNADSEEPLYTFVSFPDPHHPFNPPGRYWDMYKPEQFEINSRFSEHTNPPPPLVAWHEDREAGRMPMTRTHKGPIE